MEAKAGNHRRLAIAAAVTVIVAALIILWGLSKQSEYQRQAQQQSAENAWHTNKDVEVRCVRLPALAKRDCAVKAHRDQRDNERYEQNLVAQKTGALWTFLMGAAAIIGAMLSTVGVWLVYSTFEQNRRSADTAYEALEHDRNRTKVESRPWIGFSGFDTFDFSGGFIDGRKVADTLRFNMRLSNTGQLPALNMLVKTRYSVTDIDVLDAPDFSATLDGDPRQVGVSAAPPNREFNTADRAITGAERQRVIARTACIWLYARATYQRPSHDGDDYVTEVTLRLTLESTGKDPKNLDPKFNARMVTSSMI